MTVKNLIMPILAVASATGNCHIRAQDLGMEYACEWQTNFKGDYKWVNLLCLSASAHVAPSLTLQCATISIARTSGDPLVDDLQVYSNIDEANLPLTFATLGAEFAIARSTWFLGIRNVNEDYFTSPVTSFFVNSSCGIFPTISGNYDIANYPLSSWCLHYRYDADRLALQASVYDGQGHKNVLGHDNIFSFSPSKNGLFFISSAEYNDYGSNYVLGCAVHSGLRGGDASGVEMEAEAATPGKKVTCAPWASVEQRLTDKCSLMLQGAFSTASECKSYFGAGCLWDLKRVKCGIFADHSRYDGISETAAELSVRYPINDNMYVQSAYELIRTGHRTASVALVRFSYTL